MPYIRTDLRNEFDPEISILTNKILGAGQNSEPGNLNYIITSLILQLLPSDIKYADLNRMIGVLSCCQHELYRRLGAHIERNAIDKNTDLDFYTKHYIGMDNKSD